MGLTRRKDSWYVEFRVTDDGKVLRLDPAGRLKRWKVGCLDKKLASTQEALIKTRLLSGQEPSASIVSTSLSFNALADKYLELDTVKRCRSQSLFYQVQALREYFGSKRLSEITTQDVLDYRAKRVPRAVQTINLEHARLVTMLNVARRIFGWNGSNVASDVPRPDPRNKRDTVLSEAGLASLMKHAAPHLRNILIVAHDTGARRGEILNLKWSEVNLDRREFTLRRTKNNETRVVPMTDRVFELLCQLTHTSDYVFTYQGAPLKEIRRAFEAACRRAGIAQGKDGLRFHDLRHTAATNLRRAGVDTMTAMKIVGHKSEAMHRRYNTITTDDMHTAIRRLNK